MDAPLPVYGYKCSSTDIKRIVFIIFELMCISWVLLTSSEDLTGLKTIAIGLKTSTELQGRI